MRSVQGAGWSEEENEGGIKLLAHQGGPDLSPSIVRVHGKHGNVTSIGHLLMNVELEWRDDG